MAIYFNGVAVTSITFNGQLLDNFTFNGVQVLSSPVGFTYQYNGTAYTDASGERFLEDVSGTQDIKLVSGRGLQFNGTTQRVLDSYQIDTYFEGFMMYSATWVSDGEALTGCYDGTNRFYFGNQGGKLAVGIGSKSWADASRQFNFGYTVGQPINLIITWDASGNFNIYDQNGSTVSFSEPSYVMNDPFSIGAYTSDNNSIGLSASNTVFLAVCGRKNITSQEATQHFNNPEHTVYLENGVLKSDILPQATLDSMAAGNCFAYLMTENENCSGNLTNICTNTTSEVRKWSSTMHTNVADHSHGIQTALLDQDANGVPTGLTSIDVQATDFADAQTQFTNENGLTLTDNSGTWELTK
jgi:hypothetical protein